MGLFSLACLTTRLVLFVFYEVFCPFSYLGMSLILFFCLFSFFVAVFGFDWEMGVPEFGGVVDG